ncbi:MAG: HAD hydrolase-like protein [Crocinitomicaceae bacterium]|nr:HAD hydrolase-like protein [Crocinitomicaceae bacterium]
MKSGLKHVFFDLDGTLADSFLGIKNGIQYALQKSDEASINEETIQRMVGIPLAQSLEEICGVHTTKLNQVISDFRDYYSKTGLYESELYSGVKPLLISLSRNVKIHLVTAKPTPFAKEILKYHGVDEVFTNVMGWEEQLTPFDKGKLILSVKCNPQEAIMIGDKQEDIVAGRDTGIITAAVTYGYGKESELLNANPDFVFHTTEQLSEFLL